MTVSFSQFPSDNLVPGAYVETTNTSAGTYSPQLRALIIGQSTTAANTATPELVTSTEAAIAKYGAGSQIARMIQAFRENNIATEVHASALADGVGSTKATQVLTIAGTATAGGTLFLYIGDDKLNIGVSSADTATVIGAAVALAVTNNVLLPVTAVNVSGVVTFTAKNGGTVANSLQIQVNYRSDLGYETLPAGITAVVATGVTGATDPTLATALTNLGDLPYEYIAQPYSDTTSLDAMRDFLALRWGPLKDLFGSSYTAVSGTSSTLATIGGNRNDPYTTIIGYNGSPTWSPEVAAAAVGQVSLSLNIDPALTLHTVALVGVMVPKSTSFYTYTELQTLLGKGITPLNYVGGYARLVELVTTYQKNSFGMADSSYRFVTTLATNARLARECQFMILSKFPRCKLAPDTQKIGAGTSVVTPGIIKGELVSMYDQFINLGWVTDKVGFETEIIVEIDSVDASRLNILFPPRIIGNLNTIAIKNAFRLRATG
jgi:phage tail sheath gpL-like